MIGDIPESEAREILDVLLSPLGLKCITEKHYTGVEMVFIEDESHHKIEVEGYNSRKKSIHTKYWFRSYNDTLNAVISWVIKFCVILPEAWHWLKEIKNPYFNCGYSKSIDIAKKWKTIKLLKQSIIYLIG